MRLVFAVLVTVAVLSFAGGAEAAMFSGAGSLPTVTKDFSPIQRVDLLLGFSAKPRWNPSRRGFFISKYVRRSSSGGNMTNNPRLEASRRAS